MSAEKIIALFSDEDERVERSDEALVGACTRGDADALATLFDRHHRGMQRFLARTFTLQASDLEDILQQVFLEVYQKADRFSGRSSARTWMYGIAYNKARHAVRARSRRGRLHLALTEHFSSAPPVTAPLSDALVDTRDELVRLERACDELPEHLRAVFVMVDLEGFAGVDAARALDLKEGTLYRRLYDARTRLRAALEEVRS